MEIKYGGGQQRRPSFFDCAEEAGERDRRREGGAEGGRKGVRSDSGGGDGVEVDGRGDSWGGAPVLEVYVLVDCKIKDGSLAWYLEMGRYLKLLMIIMVDLQVLLANEITRAAEIFGGSSDLARTGGGQLAKDVFVTQIRAEL
ncbi:hypothetical protein LINPERPRIM_LOCUS6087 [Linum perenne]